MGLHLVKESQIFQMYHFLPQFTYLRTIIQNLVWQQVKLFGPYSHYADDAYNGISVSIANSPAQFSQNPTTITGAFLCGTTDDFSFDRLHGVPYFFSRDNNSTISCDEGTRGRYVHVSKTSGLISITEIEVFAREQGETWCPV